MIDWLPPGLILLGGAALVALVIFQTLGSAVLIALVVTCALSTIVRLARSVAVTDRSQTPSPPPQS